MHFNICVLNIVPCRIFVFKLIFSEKKTLRNTIRVWLTSVVDVLKILPLWIHTNLFHATFYLMLTCQTRFLTSAGLKLKENNVFECKVSKKISIWNKIHIPSDFTSRVSDSFDLDQAKHFVGSDHGSNCLRRLSVGKESIWLDQGWSQFQQTIYQKKHANFLIIAK